MVWMYIRSCQFRQASAAFVGRTGWKFGERHPEAVGPQREFSMRLGTIGIAAWSAYGAERDDPPQCPAEQELLQPCSAANSASNTIATRLTVTARLNMGRDSRVRGPASSFQEPVQWEEPRPSRE